MVGQRACANLRTLAVPLGGCANAGVSFFLARCARGGCKWSDKELALIYVARQSHEKAEETRYFSVDHRYRHILFSPVPVDGGNHVDRWLVKVTKRLSR